MPVPRLVILIIALVGCSACGIIGTIINLQMVERVNSQMPPESQFFPIGWYIAKSLRLKREYRRLYPNGKLLLAEKVVAGGMFVCVAACAWALGFFQLIGSYSAGQCVRLMPSSLLTGFLKPSRF